MVWHLVGHYINGVEVWEIAHAHGTIQFQSLGLNYQLRKILHTIHTNRPIQNNKTSDDQRFNIFDYGSERNDLTSFDRTLSF